ncbi:MAG: 23S rRNA (guanosine(2251)-2'-O)-methyltransferase RlmB [Rhodobiaceae bacterium]|jgi:23S rRNA (guanosine2251-2'-O)-methyltransferase|nr:23S rRNA (guanosine(2251)-2'-O)-methyltransferase RlmB [Rhodobiaceae bacterium]MBT7279558.1 23S rRNA (guanosine(2251)-2'-O)-methyltransferase RlmB [Rhodobiaceae bacterium]MDG2495629.1 23S rRNA (guanosine(2251)-2'-O)-methyltransferase RlmB [Alphaproteobacteria bacterium]
MSKRKPNHLRNKRKITSETAVTLLYGTHAVRAALENPKRRVNKLFATQNAANELQAICAKRKISAEIQTSGELAALLPADAVHQGMVLDASPLVPLSLEDAAASGKLLIILDQVSDPRNVGAILRAAAVFGAGGVIVTKRNSPPPAGTLAKTAVGALEVMPLIEVTNLARALETLHKAGYMSVGLDEHGETLIEDVSKDRPIAVVMGAEGPGLRRLTRETCDMLARLPVAESASGEAFATLNVATATAVTLYALTR